MEIQGVKSHRMLSKFIKVLRNHVRSVKDVHEQRLKHGTAVLDVMLAGDTRAMATELEAKDFGGTFKIEIEKVSANAITSEGVINPFTGEKMKFERSPGNFSVRRVEGVTCICLYDDSARELRVHLSGRPDLGE